MNKYAHFAEILSSCRTPSMDVMRKALEERLNLSLQEADFVTYMAGFTHYAEAASVLGEFGISISDDFPIICDEMAGSIHAKIFVNDLTQEIESLTSDYLMKNYQATKFINYVACKLSNGAFVEDFAKATRNFSAAEFYAFTKNYDPGIKEELVSYRKTYGGLNPTRLVFHFACVPARNTAERLQRLFTNVSAIVAVNHPDQGFNLSIRRLRAAPEIHPSLKAALWYVINTSEASDLIDFLNEIEAEYVLVPYQGLEGDYIVDAIEGIEARIKKMKDFCD